MEAVRAVGVDVGGSRVRAAVVDIATGRRDHLVNDPTAEPSTPEAIAEQVAGIVADLDCSGPVGVTLPGVISGGIVDRATNLDGRWARCDAAGLLRSTLGRPVALLNDADAAGLAEVRLGAGRGMPGTVLLLTFGTGVGSAVFVDGALAVGTELGHLRVAGGSTVEETAARRVIKEEGLKWLAWVKRADSALEVLCNALNPARVIIGGGVSDDVDQWRHLLPTRSDRVVVARFRGDAGVVGAALYAHEELTAVTAPRR